MSDPFPPPNPSVRWFRIVVWLMPTCFAYATAEIFSRLESNPASSSSAWFIGWIGVNVACIIGFALLDRKLSNPTAAWNDSIRRLAAFLFLQFLIVPLALIAIAVANLHVD